MSPSHSAPGSSAHATIPFRQSPAAAFPADFRRTRGLLPRQSSWQDDALGREHGKFPFETRFDPGHAVGEARPAKCPRGRQRAGSGAGPRQHRLPPHGARGSASPQAPARYSSLVEHASADGLPTRGTRGLLYCGLVAGPVFVTTFLAEGATRDGYRPSRHPVSSLALGPRGRVQAANFAVTATTMLATTALASAGFNQSPRLVNLAGLFQRASIVTGFGWLTARSAQAFTRAPAASASRLKMRNSLIVPGRETVGKCLSVMGRGRAGITRNPDARRVSG